MKFSNNKTMTMTLVLIAIVISQSYHVQANYSWKGIPSIAVNGDRYGEEDVAGWGEWIAVGSYRASAVNPGNGKCVLYRLLSNGTLAETQTLVPNTDATDRFGYGVSMHKNLLVVGAPEDNDVGSATGAAYVYKLNVVSQQWEFVQKLTPGDPRTAGGYGQNVACDDDSGIVIVGAYSWGASNAGNVFAYHRTGPDTWVEYGEVRASDYNSGDNYGVSVAVRGTRMVAGAYYKGGSSGTIYVFDYNVNLDEWSQTQRVDTDPRVSGSEFGSSVTLCGNDPVASAWKEGTGAVYWFNGTNFSQLQRISPGSTGRFGGKISCSDDGLLLAIGASEDDQVASNAGAVYLYALSEGTWSVAEKLVAGDQG